MKKKGEMFFNKIFASLHLHRVEQVDLCNFGDKVGVKLDGVVIGMMGRKLVMSFLWEDVGKVFAPFRYSKFHYLDGLSNLSEGDGLVN